WPPQQLLYGGFSISDLLLALKGEVCQRLYQFQPPMGCLLSCQCAISSASRLCPPLLQALLAIVV
ncbi:MAG: hypothetical protein ACPL3C_11125, partial [Pyrobaculum sp.]